MDPHEPAGPFDDEPNRGSALSRVEAALRHTGSKKVGANWNCPAHDDRNPSLSVEQGDGRILVYCHAGCETGAVAEALGLGLRDLFDSTRPLGRTESIGRNVETTLLEVARYAYHDHQGELISTKIRLEGNSASGGRRKSFRWEPKKNPQVLYGLRAVVEADHVWINEGEKAADRMVSALPPDHAATCAPTPAWGESFTQALLGKSVTIVVDRDPPGIKQARAAFDSLTAAGVHVQCVQSAITTEKADAFDHFEAGFGTDDFVPFDIGAANPLASAPMTAPRREGDCMKFPGFKSVPEDASPTIPEVNVDSYFDRTDGFMPSVMGQRLLKECRVVVGEGGQLYRYVDGVYRADAEPWIASRVREILGKRFKRRHRDESLAWFRSVMPVDVATPPLDFLNVRNGLLAWDGSPLKPHTPDVVSTVQIPVDWNPHARSEGILGFLRDVLPDEETVQFVLEVIGYALFPRNTFHVAILLRGPGRNGKSVLLAIIQALLGEANVAAVPLQQFAENRFAAASLVGKLANICGDLDARAISRTDLFKMLTGGDSIYTERKYGAAFSFRSFALPIFSANEPPQSADQSEAWFERWLVVPMEKTIAPEDRDPNLIATLTTTDELEGLLVEAVNALARLQKRGRFKIPASVQAARDDYRERLDSVSSFIADELRFEPEGHVTRLDLAKAYRDHCRELDLHAVPTGRLYDRVRVAYPGVKESKRHGTRGFVGVSIR